MAVATVLGIWFGLRAPEVSPVTPTDQVVQVPQVVDAPGDQRREDRR